MKTELARPNAFPAPRPHSVEVRETHVSCVFLGERDVFKVKKPVNLGFLDFRTLEARKQACDAEVTLNRRLAPHTYLGVVPVVQRRDGTLAFGGEGTTVDWAVHMQRVPDRLRADVRLTQGSLEPGTIDAVAERLAAFHASARCDEHTSAFGRPEAIAANVAENFAQTRDQVGGLVTLAEAEEIEAWQLGFLRDHAPLFESRAAAERIRDGHGDLRLEHVYAGERGELTILDCIEFNERFRFADVCADVAFLAMDLAWHGRVDLAERFLAAYARASGDYDLYALVDFYESYRAYVRAKVAMFAAADPGMAPAARERARLEARRFFLLALAAHRRSVMRPLLVCVCGIIASGKSTTAAAIAETLGAPVIEADRTRKQMLGLEPRTRVHERAWAGAYDRVFTERVYAEVLRRADVVLASGRPVIVDASFRSAAERAHARELARRRGIAVKFVECVVRPEMARARLAARERAASVSDGRLEIFDAFCARFEPLREIPENERVILDTAAEPARSAALLRAAIPAWPRGFLA
ncbi:MAG TPA: AAA family ATPase [Polyangiaceae bacterium]|jgi:hypothetical protein